MLLVLAFTRTPLAADGEEAAMLALDIEVPQTHADVLASLVQRGEHISRAAA